jgi:hypothetical protein
MVKQRSRPVLDRWVTPGAQKVLAGMAVLSFLALLSWFPLSRYLDSINWWAPPADVTRLQARAQREQPVGGTLDETVAFLRTLGFEERYIRIRRYPATHPFSGRLARIEAWIPQRYGFYGPSQILAYCKFAAAERLEECAITRGGPLEPDASGNIVETTPMPTP